MKMKQKILNNMVYIAVVAVLITTTLIGMFTYYRYMEQIKTGMKDEAAYLAASLNLRISKISINIKILQSQGLQGSLRMERLFMIAAGKKNPWETIRIVQKSKKHLTWTWGRYSYVNDITKTDLLLCAEVKRWNDSSDEPEDQTIVRQMEDIIPIIALILQL